MEEKEFSKVIGIDPIPQIPVRHFIAPRGLDLTHHNYIIMDGRYYCFLYIKGDGYPNRVRGGWMSSLINAGEGIDIDVHLTRENRSKTIDKVAQRIRLNRTKLKSMHDTSTDYEELTNSIQAGYYIKNGIANHNEDLFYNAWAQLTEQSVRALIMTSAMAVSPEENLVDTLMMELNSSEEFRETTERFIKHFNR